MHEPVKLSICIATYNRGKFIGETLDTILDQLQPGVELIVLDGASPDNTYEVMQTYLAKYPAIRYIREEKNSGIDADYDKVVAYALGEYCWLMTDDDLLYPSAIKKLIAKLDHDVELVVVNSDVKNVNFTKTLDDSLCKLSNDKDFTFSENQLFFQEVTQALSFVGSVVIRRDLWLARDRVSYYGSLFVHVGVIYQSPSITKIKYIAQPLISIRYGNAMWTPRGFEIWMFKWPELIWSFNSYTESAKAIVYQREPWRKFRLLALYRAIGGYGLAQYSDFLKNKANYFSKIIYLFVAITPANLMNALISLHCALLNKNAKMAMYSLVRSQNASWVTRICANILDVND